MTLKEYNNLVSCPARAHLPFLLVRGWGLETRLTTTIDTEAKKQLKSEKKGVISTFEAFAPIKWSKSLFRSRSRDQAIVNFFFYY